MKIRIKYRKKEIERINNLEEKVTLLTKDLDQIYKKMNLTSWLPMKWRKM